MKQTRHKAMVAVAALALLATGCGSDDDTATDDPATEASVSDAQANDTAAAGTSDSGTGDSAADDAESATRTGGTGSAQLDGETIEFTEVLCYLEPQPAASGGGNILFVAQGHGTNTAGEPIMVDVSRYDEDSIVAGDTVDVVIGEVTAADAVQLGYRSEAEAVTLVENTVSARDLTMDNFETMTQHTVSFEFSC